MKRVLIDAYCIIYKISKSSILAYILAIILISIGHLFILFGVTKLMHEWMKFDVIIGKLLIYPFYYPTFALMAWINYRMMPKPEILAKARKQPIFFLPIILYIVAILLICLYFKYYDKLFIPPPRKPRPYKIITPFKM